MSDSLDDHLRARGDCGEEASAREIAAEHYRRIAQQNGKLNAFLTLCERRAYAQADRSGRVW